MTWPISLKPRKQERGRKVLHWNPTQNILPHLLGQHLVNSYTIHFWVRGAEEWLHPGVCTLLNTYIFSSPGFDVCFVGSSYTLQEENKGLGRNLVKMFRSCKSKQNLDWFSFLWNSHNFKKHQNFPNVPGSTFPVYLEREEKGLHYIMSCIKGRLVLLEIKIRKLGC